jgi:hypothetical protein
VGSSLGKSFAYQHNVRTRSAKIFGVTFNGFTAVLKYSIKWDQAWSSTTCLTKALNAKLNCAVVLTGKSAVTISQVT